MLTVFALRIFRNRKYAGVVELVDSTDLGAVTSVKDFLPVILSKAKNPFPF